MVKKKLFQHEISNKEYKFINLNPRNYHLHLTNIFYVHRGY